MNAPATARQLSLLDEYVAPAPGDQQFDRLVQIALELVETPTPARPFGVTVGETVFVYEKLEKRQVGGEFALTFLGASPEFEAAD